MTKQSKRSKRSRASAPYSAERAFTLTVDGEEWEVVTRKAGYRGVFPLGGLALKNQHRIVLDPYTTRKGRRQTLWHELAHVAYHKGGLTGRWSDRLEETVVEAMDWLFVILVENPALAEFLVTGREEGL